MSEITKLKLPNPTLKSVSLYPLVYLATPYSKYPAGIEEAFIDAAMLTGALLVAGVKVYSPIAHTHPIATYAGLDPYDHGIWIPFDEAIMTVSSAILVAEMEGWQESKGIAHEIDFFTKAGKPVHYLNPKTMDVR